MSEALEDFWPSELPALTDPAPVVLLKEQAALLGGHTNGEVVGLVKPSTEGGTVYYSLYLKADDLGDYLYKILSIAHPAVGQSDDYPIMAESSAGGPSTSIADDAEFRRWLRAQLSSDYVRSAIGNLQRYIRERRATRVG